MAKVSPFYDEGLAAGQMPMSCRALGGCRALVDTAHGCAVDASILGTCRNRGTCPHGSVAPPQLLAKYVFRIWPPARSGYRFAG
jgi:hypothetical protein